MSSVWPERQVIKAIQTIMGNIRRDGRMPQQRIPECRDTLGAAIVDRLKLAEVAPRKLDALVERVLRAVVDADCETPDMMSARELLGFTLRSPEQIAELVQDPTADLAASEIENGYKSKAVRLYLAGLHHDPPVAVRTARGKQRSVWAPAMSDALDDYLDQSLDEAKGIAADMGLRFRPDESSTESQGDPVESSAHGTIDPMPGQLERPNPLSLPSGHLLDFSERLEPALDAVLAGCKARGRRVYTFDVLLALLDMPAGQVRDCFDDVKQGLSDVVRQVLRTMPAPGKHVDPFVPPKWHLRPEIAQAWRYASRSSRPYVTELDVLLAILAGSSGTNLWLKSHVLRDTHAQVRARVEQRRKNPDGDRSPVPD